MALVDRCPLDRTGLANGIVHLGIGAFARAHLLPATQAAMLATGDRRWGVTGISLRSADTRDALAPQGGCYTLALRDADEHGAPRERREVIGALTRLLVGTDDPAALPEALADPATRIVSLTITEKGYRDPTTGALDLLARGLALRRARGLDPVTLLSLDNLPANGDSLRGLLLGHAAKLDGALADWIAQRCTFPNSMVDRIVPRTTDADRDRIAHALGERDAWPVVGEPFFDWVVEDRFAAGRPDWTVYGARFVERAEPFETLKLRMVNGAHSAIAYLGAVAGWATVDAAVGQPALRRYADTMLRDEVAPTLHGLPGFDLDAYRARLLARFANPALAHRTQQIAMDGSQKLPQRLLNTVRDRLRTNAPIDRLALAVAAWVHYLRGVDEAGAAYPIQDPLAPALAEQLARAEGEATETARITAFCRFEPVFGDLAGHAGLAEAVAVHTARLRGHGVAATLAALR